jgi:hypothetical protein
MRALVMSLFLFTNALSSALGEIVTPAIIDPHLIWVWAGPAIAMAFLTAHFYFTFRHLDNDEFMTEHNENIIGEDRNGGSIKGEGTGEKAEGGDEKATAAASA